jgi:hypothetical protein
VAEIGEAATNGLPVEKGGNNRNGHGVGVPFLYSCTGEAEWGIRGPSRTSARQAVGLVMETHEG